MKTIRDHHSGDLFDPWGFLGDQRRQLLDRSWTGVFREHLLAALPVGKLAEHFHGQKGRPSKDLHVAMGVLILQQLHDLTDAATVEALAFNIMWHYALDLRDGSDAYLCEKTLRNYRRLVIDHGLDELLFRSLTDELIKAFEVDTTKQRLDSTAIRSSMRSLTRLGTVVETISKFLRELARVEPAWHQRVDRGLIRRYVEREGEGCFADTKPSVSKRRLPEAGRDLLTLATMFRDTPAASLDSFAILERVLSEQFEVTDMDRDDDDPNPTLRVKEPKEIPCDNVRNPADPDSSYNKHRGQGYLTQVMETYQEDDGPQPPPAKPDLITHVSIYKMTAHDSQCLDAAIEDVQHRQAQPRQLLADSPYGSNDHLQATAEQGIALVSPAMPPKGSKQGRLALEQFELDDEDLIARCPGGHAPIATSRSKQKLQARFDTSICQSCPLLESCPVRPTLERGEPTRYQYTPQRVAMRARRLADQTQGFKQVYRWRAGIEATMSRLKHQMRLAHLRVRGLAAVTHRVLLRALGLNIHRCAAFASV